MVRRTSLLPREGFHAAVLGRLLRRTILSPLLLLPLLALSRYSDRLGQAFTLHSKFPAQLKPYLDRAIVILNNRAICAATRLLTVLSLLRIINGWLNRRTINNHVLDTYNWKDEIIVVTGGSDGIGKRIVLLLAGKGIKVVVLDIQPLTYKARTSSLISKHQLGSDVYEARGVSFGFCDITSTESITKAAHHIRQDIGQPTILVNNAGLCFGKTLLENKDEDLRLTFEVNTISHYKLAREFLPSMIHKNHGMIVTVSSIASWFTAPRMTDYAASKAAANAFHEGLSAELATIHNAPKVRTVLVNLGYTMTSLFDGFDTKSDQFFAPALRVETVAEAIVVQILSGESGHICLPGEMSLIGSSFGSLPYWMQHSTRTKKLANLMDGFHGRHVTQPSRKG